MTSTWMNRVRLLAIAAAFAVSGPALASDFFAEELGDDAKIMDKVKYDHFNGSGDGSESGRGPKAYLKALGVPPKRVALITFYVKDSGNADKHTYALPSTWKNVTASGIDMIAKEIYDPAIGPMKETFKAAGMDLLTHDQFLDTPQKRNAYESFKLEFSAAGHFVNWLSKTDKDSTKFEGVAEGYRLLSVPTNVDVKGKDFGLMGGDGKLYQSLGDKLCHALDVDAVAVMYSVVQNDGKTIDLLGSYLYLFGPNPVKRTDDPSLYWTGHIYSGVQIKCRVPIIKTKKGQMTDEDFAGFARVAKALSVKTGEFLVARTKGEK